MRAAIAAGFMTVRSADRRVLSQRLRARRQDAEVERAARRLGVALELHGRPAPIAAVERRVFDPLPQRAIAAQRAPDRQAEIPGIGFVKSSRPVALAVAARAAMAVNEANARRAHLPGLFQDARQRRALDVARMVAVQIDLHARECGAVRRLDLLYALLSAHQSARRCAHQCGHECVSMNRPHAAAAHACPLRIMAYIRARPRQHEWTAPAGAQRRTACKARSARAAGSASSGTSVAKSPRSALSAVRSSSISRTVRTPKRRRIG